MINSNLYSHKAQELLLNIYQQDKNWLDAIETAKRLATSDYSYHTEVAQFNCELAQETLIKSDSVAAETYIAKALETNRKCVRANILLGEVFFSQENYAKAIESWQLIEKQNYLYLPMIVDRIFDAYIQLDKIKEGLRLIKGYTTLYSQLNLCTSLYSKLLQYETSEIALNYLRSTFNNHPSSRVAALLVELHLNTLKDSIAPEVKPDIELIKNLLLKYHEKLSSYRCGRCNFKAKTFFWQCPACYEWESISPSNSEG